MAHIEPATPRAAEPHEFLAPDAWREAAGLESEALTKSQAIKLIRPAVIKSLVLDRKGIERAAGDFYGVPEKEYQRLYQLGFIG